MSRLAAFLLACLLLPLGLVQAHVAGSMGYATVSIHGGTVRYRLTLPTDALAALEGRQPLRQGYAALGELVARNLAILADGKPCAPVPGTVTPPSPDRATIIVTLDYACPGTPRELTLHDNLSDAFGGDYHTLASIETPAGAQQHLLEPDRREARAVLAPAPQDTPPAAAEGGVLDFFRLGIGHILTGFDHLLFLLALLLRGGGLGSLLAIVTAFTVAHSITLALAVLQVVSLPPAVVEPLIALSIAYVAAENILARRPIARRWIEGFVFGLLHGFGFAGALLELELPPGALAWSLLSFNLGVEAGQAMVILLLLPALVWLRGVDREQRAVTTLSALVLAAGLVLLVERVLVSAG